MTGGILTGRGINAQRKILSSGYDTRKELRDLQTSSVMPFLFKAVVVDVLVNSDTLEESEKEELRGNLKNPQFLDNAPRNSILARVITKGTDHRDNLLELFYPFLPPFLCMPIKPGEQCWAIYDNPENYIGLGYWLWRPTENVNVDDLNFTHGDRRFLNEEDIKGKEPKFPNGGGNENNRTLSDEDDFEEINDNSSANNLITKEVVPRYNKRPADMVLQGSNNALIVLGEDRKASFNKEGGEQKEKAGTIDVVVGRGKNIPSNENEIPQRTAPPVITNSRNEKEVNKFPDTNNKNNPKEGDPDFNKDSARLYLSMNTNGDENFGLNFPNLNNNKSINPVNNASYSILKADEIRIVSRKDDEDNINGSIKILKEGNNDKATIVMEKSGEILIESGNKVIVESPEIFIGKDSTEAMVLGNQLKSLLKEILQKLATHTHISPTSGGPTSPPSPPELVDFNATLVAKLENILSKTSKVK